MSSSKFLLSAFLLGAALFAAPAYAQTSGSASAITATLAATPVSIKSKGGFITALDCRNPDATNDAYVQFFDASSVTLGTTSPKFSVYVPHASSKQLTWPIGANFYTAIQVAATTTYNGATPAVTALYCNIWYN